MHLDLKRRDQVARNIKRIHGYDLSDSEIHIRVKSTFASYAHYWLRSFRLVDMTVKDLEKNFTYDGWEKIADARDKGPGPILVLPHLGTWDWGGLWLKECKNISVSAVVEELEPNDLFQWFRKQRMSLGMEIISSGPKAGPEVLKALKKGNALVLVADRNVGGASVEVEFFGEMTSLPSGPAVLALRTGAELLPAAMYDVDDCCHGVVRPPVTIEREGNFRKDVLRLTQRLAQELELLIREAPDQWHLLQPNWPSDLDEKKR